MVNNKLFRQCLSVISKEERAEFNLAFGVAERLYTILNEKGITQHELAVRLKKKDSEISKWLSGRHNFTLKTIAQLEENLQTSIIDIAR